jgi:hypothetical protein
MDSLYKIRRRGFLESLFMDQPVHEFYLRFFISILVVSIGIVTRQYIGLRDGMSHGQESRLKSRDVKTFASSIMSRPKHLVIISGTGRAGTTFLVQLLTALKLDTSFDDPMSGIAPINNAGMEMDIRQPNAPHIIKGPQLSDTLDEFLRTNHAIIDRAIISVRDLYSAAESRRDVFRRAGGPYPGGLWHAEIPEDMESVLTQQLYELFFTLAKHNIPVTLLYFPRLVNEPKYLYREIKFLFPNISYKKFLRSFQSVRKPELVHVFKQA